jgi:isopentenyl-diphosphate delta-isomerase
MQLFKKLLVSLIILTQILPLFPIRNKFLQLNKPKSEAHTDGLWHRTVNIFIYTNKEEVLLQLRNSTKDLYPNTWDISVGGHIDSGESPLKAAIREIKEEIALEVLEKDLKFIKIVKSSEHWKKIINNEFQYIYLLEYNDSVNKLKPQKEEIQSIKFQKIKNIIQDLTDNKNKYVPRPFWLDILSEIKRRI